MFLGGKIDICKAQEPSNIIWENKHVKGIYLYKRLTRVLMILLVILFFAFGFIVQTRQ